MERITLTEEQYEQHFPERYLAYKAKQRDKQTKDNRWKIDEIHEKRRDREDYLLGDER